MSPVLGRGPQLAPGEGQAGTRVATAEGPVVGGVSMQRRSLKGGREPSGGRVDLRRGAHHPQTGQAKFVREKEVEWGKAGFRG